MISNLNPDPDTLDLMALCGWREARGEGREGVRAVLHVIQNRSTKWRQTYHEVVMGRNQFTSMSVSSCPEFRTFPAPGDEIYQMAWVLADQIVRYADPDNTGGATFYERIGTANSWFDAHIKESSAYKETVTIGHHVFYAEV